MMNYTKKVGCGAFEILQRVVGTFDENLQTIEEALGVTLKVDGLDIVCISPKQGVVNTSSDVLKSLVEMVEGGENVDKGTVIYLIELAKEGKMSEVSKLTTGTVAVTSRGKQIKCKTVGQKRYVDSIRKNTVTFGVGPAGTGKTYLAVCLAVQAFKSKSVDKIILTRPAVEAGEKLGFLPGDLQTKVDPYLRPLYDALQEMLGLETYLKLIERGNIEIAPLAYMRGRTLSNAFIILDEAQNTTREQMKMFLTRMGDNSKVVVTGDRTQVDLPDGKFSGLDHATKVLNDIDGIGICMLTAKDVVRHPLVMSIVRAYEDDDVARRKNNEQSSSD